MSSIHGRDPSSELPTSYQPEETKQLKENLTAKKTRLSETQEKKSQLEAKVAGLSSRVTSLKDPSSPERDQTNKAIEKLANEEKDLAAKITATTDKINIFETTRPLSENVKGVLTEARDSHQMKFKDKEAEIQRLETLLSKTTSFLHRFKVFISNIGRKERAPSADNEGALKDPRSMSKNELQEKIRQEKEGRELIGSIVKEVEESIKKIDDDLKTDIEGLDASDVDDLKSLNDGLNGALEIIREEKKALESEGESLDQQVQQTRRELRDLEVIGTQLTQEIKEETATIELREALSQQIVSMPLVDVDPNSSPSTVYYAQRNSLIESLDRAFDELFKKVDTLEAEKRALMYSRWQNDQAITSKKAEKYCLDALPNNDPEKVKKQSAKLGKEIKELEQKSEAITDELRPKNAELNRLIENREDLLEGKGAPENPDLQRYRQIYQIFQDHYAKLDHYPPSDLARNLLGRFVFKC